VRKSHFASVKMSDVAGWHLAAINHFKSRQANIHRIMAQRQIREGF
jgi:hypothetical protein